MLETEFVFGKGFDVLYQNCNQFPAQLDYITCCCEWWQPYCSNQNEFMIHYSSNDRQQTSKDSQSEFQGYFLSKKKDGWKSGEPCLRWADWLSVKLSDKGH